MASNFDSYYLQDGCWNCKHVHCEENDGTYGTDTHYTYHCNFSNLMPVPDKRNITMDHLDKWLHEYTVDESGICDEHVEAE